MVSELNLLKALAPTKETGNIRKNILEWMNLTGKIHSHELVYD